MISISAPLYEGEFGHGFSLHDAKIRAVEQTVVDGVFYMIWSLELFQAPAKEPNVERAYRYTLMFVDPSEIESVVGNEIYHFTIEDIGERLNVQAVLLPEGNEISFECRRVIEVDLASS